MALLKLRNFFLAFVLYQVYLTTAKDISNKRVVCYYTSWAKYRDGHAKFNADTDIPSNLCTHIIYAFAVVNGNTLDKFDDSDFEQYAKIMKLKECNKDLKVLLAVGGWNHGSGPFKTMTSSRANIEEFAHSARDYLNKYGFDGLDFDWEYPEEADKAKFTELVRITKEVFRQSEKPLLLTAAVPMSESKVNAGYEVEKIGKVLDFINLMAYDIHGSWDDKLGHNAPLYSSKQPGSDPKLNVDYAAELWTKKGVPKNKLVVGIPTYGRALKIADPSKTKPEDPSIPNTDFEATYTREKGYFAYYEACKLSPTVWDEDMQVPYVISDNNFMGYDDERAVENKADFINKKGYGGAMIWTLDLDDFSGKFCNKDRYPLITAIDVKIRGGKRKDYLDTCGKSTSVSDKDNKTNEIESSTPQEKEVPEEPELPQEQENEVPEAPKEQENEVPGEPESPKSPQTSNEGDCSDSSGKETFHAVTGDCTKYYRCIGQRKLETESCPSNLAWNQEITACDWKYKVPSCNA